MKRRSSLLTTQERRLDHGEFEVALDGLLSVGSITVDSLEWKLFFQSGSNPIYCYHWKCWLQ